MSKKFHCKYCGCKTHNKSGMCCACEDKLMLIRKIRSILFSIQNREEGEGRP